MRLSDLQFLLLLLLLNALVGPARVDAVSWLSLASIASVPTEKQTRRFPCRKYFRTKRQRKLCRLYRYQMTSFRDGAIRAIRECEHQFKTRRWNCSMAPGYTLFDNPLLTKGIPEASFLHAISSAGAAYQLTRNCRIGIVTNCGCDSTAIDSPELAGKTFQTHGCSDNIRYGIMFTRRFIDKSEKLKHLNHTMYMVNLHNNEAGRETIRRSMQAMCRCHGFSGSCNMKTCWRRMGDFRTIGNILKDRFNGATKVRLSSSDDRTILAPKDPKFKSPTLGDLVYLEDSPEFCEPDNHTGTLGTQGRKCDAFSRAMDGCAIMCCNRGYRSVQFIRTERCECVVYNFEVKCKQCNYHAVDHFCL